jgi:hypothetical protein
VGKTVNHHAVRGENSGYASHLFTMKAVISFNKAGMVKMIMKINLYLAKTY